MENKEHRALMTDYHALVCNQNHEVIHKFKNLGGLHKFVSQRLNTYPGKYPLSVYLYEHYKMPDDKPFHRVHKLLIFFENKDYAYIFFADYSVMKEHVKRWRNLKGLPVHEYRPFNGAQADRFYGRKSNV